MPIHVRQEDMMHTMTDQQHNQLSGDWTISGVVRQLQTLTSFQQTVSTVNSTMLVDCSNIECMDITGMQLLYTWLHCIQIKGITAYITNLPEQFKTTIDALGYGILFSHHVTPVDQPEADAPLAEPLHSELLSSAGAVYGS